LVYAVWVSRRRHRRRNEKQQRHTPPPTEPLRQPALIREAERVERLAYTRSQAAEALGISTSTFNRRLLPLIDTVQMPSGTRLIPVDELERLLAQQRQRPRAQPAPPSPAGRKPGLPTEVIERIRRQHSAGESLAEIARTLNTDSVPTSQGGRQWWPSTIRAVLNRPSPPETAQERPDHP
jgi:hypothetical protein